MKQTEIIELSIEDIKEKIEDVEMAQQKLMLAHSVSQLENPLQLRANRRIIARLKTELRKREMEAGAVAPVAKTEAKENNETAETNA